MKSKQHTFDNLQNLSQDGIDWKLNYVLERRLKIVFRICLGILLLSLMMMLFGCSGKPQIIKDCPKPQIPQELLIPKNQLPPIASVSIPLPPSRNITILLCS